MGNKFIYQIDDFVDSLKNECSNCQFRDKTIRNGYQKIICKKYPSLNNHKPLKILDGKETCDFFKKE